MRENTKELLHFTNIYQQKRGKRVWEFIIRGFDPRGQDITVDWAEFIAVDALTRDSGFDYQHVQRRVALTVYLVDSLKSGLSSTVNGVVMWKREFKGLGRQECWAGCIT